MMNIKRIKTPATTAANQQQHKHQTNPIKRRIKIHTTTKICAKIKYKINTIKTKTKNIKYKN